MLKHIQTVSSFFSHHAPLMVILSMLVTLAFPHSFDFVRRTTLTILLMFIMFTMGMTLSTNEIKKLIRRPVGVLLGMCTQFTIMSGLAYLLIHVFHLDLTWALGLLLVGCCPCGVASNVMTYLCHGDVTFSFGMSTASTLIAPVITPILLNLTIGKEIELDGFAIFLNMLIGVLIPVVVGYVINHFYGQKKRYVVIKSLIPTANVICLMVIVAGSISYVHDDLLNSGLLLTSIIFATVACYNIMGYICGWLVSRCIGLKADKTRSLTICVGIQNAGLATVIAGQFFTAQPLAAVTCAICCVWENISGSIMAAIFVRYDERQSLRAIES